jgi:hypothetical protein
MRIRFERFPDHAVSYSVIERDDGVVYRMLEFTRGGPELPHDLRHFVVERELGISDGIWGAIAAGTVYTSMEHVRGRVTFAGHQRENSLKKAQRNRVGRAELFANLVETIAMLDQPTVTEIERLTREHLACVPLSEPGQDPADVIDVPPPGALGAAASALQVEAARWARLRVGEELVYDWRPAPGPAPAVRAAGPGAGRSLVPRQREAGGRRRDPRRSGRRGPR